MMDNSAFEMHKGATQNGLHVGKMNTISRMEKKRQWSLMSVFLVCLLACTVITAVGVLVFSLVYINNSQPHSVHLEPEAHPLQRTPIPIVQKAIDSKFQFLNHLPKYKISYGVNVPSNLAELVMNASYAQSPDSLVWRYFYNLKGIYELRNNENIFSEFLNQLQNLNMDGYLQATVDHILAQLFFKRPSEFKKIPRFKEDQAINLP
ncbi:Dynactin-Associated Protein [Manis pentadactyla]|nr:Dynactin-Associated Protein [Manis pentadactyla]